MSCLEISWQNVTLSLTDLSAFNTTCTWKSNTSTTRTAMTKLQRFESLVLVCKFIQIWRCLFKTYPDFPNFSSLLNWPENMELRRVFLMRFPVLLLMYPWWKYFEVSLPCIFVDFHICSEMENKEVYAGADSMKLSVKQLMSNFDNVWSFRLFQTTSHNWILVLRNRKMQLQV